MANEFFRAFGGDAAISLTPGANSRLEVRLDDELIFDKKAEDGKFPDLGRVREMKIERGRIISQQEMALGTPVVVIGQEIATRFFPKLDPLNRSLKLAGLPYTVIGIAESQGSIFGISLDRFAIAPNFGADDPCRFTQEAKHHINLVDQANGQDAITQA